MTLGEYIKEQRERVANMTLAQARQIVANHYRHDDERIECEKAVKMLLDCADEAIQNKVPEKVQKAYEDGKKDGYMQRKLEQEQDKPMVEIDLYSVIKQKYIEREVLDEIKAEIDGLTYYWYEVHPRDVINDVFEIIDKHKAESEEEK